MKASTKTAQCVMHHKVDGIGASELCPDHTGENRLPDPLLFKEHEVCPILRRRLSRPPIMSFFTVVGFFALANKNVPGAFSFFESTITCGGNPAPVPVDVRHYRAANETPVADDAVVFVAAKAFSPGHIVPEDFLLDTIYIDTLPGDPQSATYDDHVPLPRPPVVFANGTVTDNIQTSDDPIVTFVVTVSEFVRNSRKQSVIVYVITVFTIHPFLI